MSMSEIDIPTQDPQTMVPHSEKVLITENVPKRQLIMILMACIFIIFTTAVFYMRALGDASESYDFVSNLSNQASLLGWIFSISAGVLTARLVAHPKYDRRGTVKRVNNVWATPLGTVIKIIMVIAGLFAGIVPGFILLAIFLYRSNNKEASAEQPVYLVKTKKIVTWGVVISAFFIGVIPAAIYSIIIIYPLSQKACHLSGSKYC